MRTHLHTTRIVVRIMLYKTWSAVHCIVADETNGVLVLVMTSFQITAAIDPSTPGLSTPTEPQSTRSKLQARTRPSDKAATKRD